MNATVAWHVSGMSRGQQRATPPGGVVGGESTRKEDGVATGEATNSEVPKLRQWCG